MRPRSWWAIVGPSPSPEPTGWLTTPHDRTRTLDGEYEVGPLRLRSGGKRLVEYLRLEPLDLAGVTQFESWPLIVEGSWEETSRGGSSGGPEEGLLQEPRWRIVERQGTSNLHRLCVLLSLVWGEPWQVRTSPKSLEQLPAEVPDSWPDPSQWPQSDDFPPAEAIGLPDWLGAAWDQISADPHLAAALTAWHQGLLLTPRHPSLAHVAFVGAIEELSQSATLETVVQGDLTPPCTVCGARPTASARFWSAAKQVASEDELAEFKRLGVLGYRGATAHGARFGGIETTYGSVMMLDWIPPTIAGGSARFELEEGDLAEVFVLKVVPGVRRLAQRLLLMVLNAPPTSPPRGGPSTGLSSPTTATMPSATP